MIHQHKCGIHHGHIIQTTKVQSFWNNWKEEFVGGLTLRIICFFKIYIIAKVRDILTYYHHVKLWTLKHFSLYSGNIQLLRWFDCTQ